MPKALDLHACKSETNLKKKNEKNNNWKIRLKKDYLFINLYIYIFYFEKEHCEGSDGNAKMKFESEVGHEFFWDSCV